VAIFWGALYHFGTATILLFYFTIAVYYLMSMFNYHNSGANGGKGNKIFTRKQYFKLKERGAIRLLNVIAQDDNSTILCELIPASVLSEKELVEEFHHTPEEAKAKCEPFEALSWSWGAGDARMSFIYIVKDHITYKKAVKEDLVHALRALRHPTHGKRLWVDAVCINQHNIEERNHQVEMMADIYGKAERVRVWLGPKDDSSDIAIQFIKTGILRLENFDKLCEDNSNSKKWVALLKLMQRPWFSRYAFYSGPCGRSSPTRSSTEQ
jgi:hypothetical protein